MKPRTVIILWVIAVILGTTAYFVKFHSRTETIHTNLKAGDKAQPNLQIQELASVTLTQGKDTTTLTRGLDNQWTINERANYPADHKLLRNLLGALAELQVSQGYPCNAKDFGRFGLASESEDENDLGLHITMTNAQGEKLSDLFLGKYNGATRKTMGRFIRISADDSAVYATGETFPGVYADPPAWLDKAFIQIHNIQSVSISAPENPDFKPWKLAKISATQNAQFKLTDLSDKETMRLTSTGAFRTLMAVTSFQDCLSSAEAEKTTNPDKKLNRLAVIDTFDGITYTINFWSQKEKVAPTEETPDPESPLPAVQAAYLMTVAITADLPESRTKAPDEKPENSKQLDLQFQTRQAFLKNQITLTKSFSGRTYQVGHTMLEPLLKSRQDFVSKK